MARLTLFGLAAGGAATGGDVWGLGVGVRRLNGLSVEVLRLRVVVQLNGLRGDLDISASQNLGFGSEIVVAGLDEGCVDAVGEL